ncbi:hypothetical protein [Candidatus Borrarchaeum sp.]|uniref:hypothetical protein n=1 Tax=Candidatus Borrarchaeum sp. TaxID=2846742 RepID=UPI00257C82CB|nr:hypothetical protein [Candidatus Borrarchaeum sp.]
MEYQIHEFEMEFLNALEKGMSRTYLLCGAYGSGRTHWLKNNLEGFYKKILSKLYPNMVYEEIIFRHEKARTLLETINAEIEAMENNLIYCVDDFSIPSDEVRQTVSVALTRMNQQIKEHTKSVFMFLAISRDDLSFFKEHLPEANVLYFNFDKILGKIAYPEEI